MKILLIDFNDSFTAILAQSISLASDNVDVKIEKISDVKPQILPDEYDGILLGPGPGYVEEYPVAFEIIEKNAKKIPILGVCLGHQIIAKLYGAVLSNMHTVRHGNKAFIKHFGNSQLFDGVPKQFAAGLYHSWVVEKLSSDLEVTSVRMDDYAIMSLKHKNLPIEGVQFHPESFMTDYGKIILRNWLLICNAYD